MPASEIPQTEFAELIGISSRAVFNLRQEGLSEHVTVKGKTPLVKMPEGLQWYIRYRQQQAKDKSTPTSLAAVELDNAMLEREKRRTLLDRMKGKLVEMSLVEPWASEMLARARTRIDAMVPRIAQHVTAEDMPTRRLQAQELVDEVLEELQLIPMRTAAEEDEPE